MRTSPKTVRDEPSLKQERTDSELKTTHRLLTLCSPAKRPTPVTLKSPIILADPAAEIADPVTNVLCNETVEPNLAKDLTDIELLNKDEPEIESVAYKLVLPVADTAAPAATSACTERLLLRHT